jgi:hypothetical protein
MVVPLHTDKEQQTITNTLFIMATNYRYLVFESDQWLSKRDMVLMGDFDTEDAAIDAIVANHPFKADEFFDVDEENEEKLKQDLDEEIRKTLENEHQICGRDIGYIIVTIESNQWDENGIM